MKLSNGIALGAAIAAIVACTACDGLIGDTLQTQPTEVAAPNDYERNFPFEAVPPNIYVNKVKGILTGLPATDAEIAAVRADENTMRSLVDQWFATPQAQAKLLAFFSNYFQQSSSTGPVERDYAGMIGAVGGGAHNFMPVALQQNLKDMFPRTAQQIVNNHQPFSKTVTTRTLMMTPALMAFYLYIDEISRPDNREDPIPLHPTSDGQLRYHFVYKEPTEDDPKLQKAFDDATNPESSTYLHFPEATPLRCSIPQISADGYVQRDANGAAVRTIEMLNDVGVNVLDPPVPAIMARRFPEYYLFTRIFDDTMQLIMGSFSVPQDERYSHPNTFVTDYTVGCSDWSGNRMPYVTDDDYTAWRPVTLVQSEEGDTISFYDLRTLRTRDTLKLRTARVGFFSTPPFQVTYPNNASNDARGLANQALIVALGTSINPVDKVGTTVLDFGDDTEHSNPDSPCYSCHRILDPMRNVMKKSWTFANSKQLLPEKTALEATFDFLGLTKSTPTLDDFAQALVEHPSYAAAVIDKLCYYVNSAGCSSRDVEFERITQAFVDSNYDFAIAVGELFSSPIVTGASETRTITDRGEVVSVMRFNHMCAALNNRLGFTQDFCAGKTASGLPSAIASSVARTAPFVATIVPADGFARGAQAPTLSTEPTLFFRSATEILCKAAASVTVDVAGSRYSSTTEDSRRAAIEDFVTTVAGVATSDPAHSDFVQVLNEHYAEAAAQPDVEPGNALQSAFVVACTSPTALAIGL